MNLINIGIILTYIMVVGAALTVLTFGIMRMLKHPKNAKKSLYTVGGLILVLLLGFALASSEVLPSYEKYEIDSGSAKRVGMGLIAFYVLAIGAIGAVLYTEFSKVFSK
jgi:NADH:ubiquinone oxidoreductase subunit 6 (subunit J)